MNSQGANYNKFNLVLFNLQSWGNASIGIPNRIKVLQNYVSNFKISIHDKETFELNKKTEQRLG